MKFIKDEKNNCEVFEYTERYLKEFWNDHPDGRIDFG